MRILLFVSSLGFLLLALTGTCPAQDFGQQIRSHRETYRQEFLASASSPLKKKDLKYLRFYEPDETYRLEGTFVRTPESEPFDMPTYSGQKQPYVQYGEVLFELRGERCRLAVYQSLNLRTNLQYRDYLFIPFKDPTNGKDSYGGGRYLDFRTGDIHENRLTLDFNKAYNPYCAYSDNYSCPIPPAENHLKVPIEAGEKNFGKAH
ncbi:DUF1684 domain-containing protein [Rhabdobacter roseus]|uniref:DUF1684 domain-containing protein n=1 Tax=Rhabdobacter roseus TaxID=1655419 RepID=A0A840TLU6_9BACT|nr:DUF1684 domain-containing protein [Rhabdobacter roseus]MBB5283895.1 hypothetical protein [Rhabdobacter roseus]